MEEAVRASASPWARGGLVAGGIGVVAVAALFAGHGLLKRASGLASVATSTTPVPAPPPPWTADELADLSTAIDKAGDEGLDPHDYSQAALREAVQQHSSGEQIDALATRAALALAHDYAAGHLTHRTRFDWYIPYAGPSKTQLDEALLDARQNGRLGAWLASLLPTDDQYAALKSALATTAADDQDRRDRIKVNMERWRWLPRGAWGGDKLYVNLPTYQLQVQRVGQPTTTYRVVIGAPDKRTPTLTADVKTVVANPVWIVPASIVKSSHLQPGGRYQFTNSGGHVRVIQKAGPGNALGRVKIEIPNKMAIYLHDTPSKYLFARDARAFSHGCVRVQNIEALAADILDDDPKLATALAGEQTRWIKVAHPWRTEIVYLTMRAAADGTLVDLGDPYKLDPEMAAALSGRPMPVDPSVVAAKAKLAKPAHPVTPADIDPTPDAGDTVDRSTKPATPADAAPAVVAEAPTGP